MSNGTLPSYLSMAKPNPPTNRAPWYKNTAPTYAGIFLWFVFWSQAPRGGSGTPGGCLMPGFLMGALQFGGLGVNAYFSSLALAPLVGGSAAAVKVLAVL